jgi:SAM-dependent methyltransferase
MANVEQPDTPPSRSAGAMEGCLCCGGATKMRYSLARVWDRPAGSRPFEIRWCESCDFGFLQPQPTEEDLARFEQKGSAVRIATVRAPEVRTLAEKVRIRLAWQAARGQVRPIDAKLIHAAAGGHLGSICIFGCGQLELLVQLKDMGHTVLGFDLSEEVCRNARAKGLDVSSGSIDARPPQVLPRGFDAVFLDQVLRRSGEPRTALRNANRLIKTGGCLLVEVPNHNALSARRLGPAWCLWKAESDLSFFTHASLSRLMEIAGYHVKEIVYRRYIPQFTRLQMITEQEQWDRLYGNFPEVDQTSPPRNSPADLWISLFRTMMLGPAKKFEIVGIIGIKRPAFDVNQ